MAIKRTTKSTANSQQDQATKSIPSPFKPAPSLLAPFLLTLSKEKVYITHLDSNPLSQKLSVFLVPVAINLTLLILLIKRAVYILPWYWYITRGIFDRGQWEGAPVGNGAQDPWNEGSRGRWWMFARRMLTFLLDYLLVSIVWKWPLGFFFEVPGNPVLWRLRVGFQPHELIVRESRGWTAEDLLEGNKKGDESAFWKTRIEPNVTEEVFGKAGYVGMNKDWDLDFAAMVTGQKLFKSAKKGAKGTPDARDLNRKILIWSKATNQWLIHDLPYNPSLNPLNTDLSKNQRIRADTADKDLQFEGSEAGRDQILKFKEKLTDMNQEDLFYKWIELVQTEARRPGFRASADLQLQLGLKVQALFEEHGVDWDAFAKEVGMV